MVINEMFDRAQTDSECYAIAYGFLGQNVYSFLQGHITKKNLHNAYETLMPLMKQHLNRLAPEHAVAPGNVLGRGGHG